jgi:hydroxyacylglutathione hydrolase
MVHEILPVGMLQCNCSIFGDEKTKEAMVIDPGDDLQDIQAVLAKHDWTVKAIVITHAHIDHIGGAAKLNASTGAPVYMNQNDSELARKLDVQAAWLRMPVPDTPRIDVDARDGDVISVSGTSFHVLHTPGHTQGSVSLFIPQENKLIAGDTLFQGSIGRTDLPGGNSRQILVSIHSKLLTLPDETIVIPGHGSLTTIGREKESNPFLIQS